MSLQNPFSLLVAVTLVAVPLTAQGQPDRIPDPLDFPVRESLRPNYLSEILPPEPAMVPIPPPPAGEAPAAVRGLYISGWTFGSRRLQEFIDLADTTEINALVIDVKDDEGFMTYASSVPTAIEIGANRQPRARDARERLARLNQSGIYTIARIVVAKDPTLANGKPDWAIQDSRGGLWEDALGLHWVDAHNDSVWIYAADVAAEAVLMGFDEVQFDYVRFPDEPPERMQYAVFPSHQEGTSRRASIRRHLTYLRDRVNAMNVPFTIDVFGLTTSARDDMGIGQYWDDFVQLADVVLPMVYPSHYGRGSYGLDYPNAEPYEIITRALRPGIERSERFEQPARIRPYLQSFSIMRPIYRAPELREQIRAVEDLGLTDWVFWNARNRYPENAFRSRDTLPSEEETTRAEADSTRADSVETDGSLP